MAENKKEKKFCMNCGAEMDLKSKFCSKCGGNSENVKSNQVSNVSNNVGTPKWVKILIIILVILFVTVACTTGCTLLVGSAVDETLSSDSNKNDDNDDNNNYNSSEGSDDSSYDDTLYDDGAYSLGETFKFDELEITFGTEIGFSKVNNRYSDYNGKTVVKLPITVKNLKKETHGLNMFYYNFYGSQGTEVKDLGNYFDNDVAYAGDLRSGASYTKYVYFQYDGDGTYAIEFDNYSQKIIVEFEIKK